MFVHRHDPVIFLCGLFLCWIQFPDQIGLGQFCISAGEGAEFLEGLYSPCLDGGVCSRVAMRSPLGPKVTDRTCSV